MFVLNLQVMRKLITVLLGFCSILIFSQKDKNILNEIDSIAQNRWKATALNVDSLANPTYEKFSVKMRDTIVMVKPLQTVDFSEEIPVTPYNLLQLKDPIKWFYHGQN